VNHFCNVDPAGTQMLDWTKLGPGVSDLAKAFVERFQAKHRLRDLPPHASMGFNNTWIFLNDVLAPAVRKTGGMTADALREAALAVDIPVGRDYVVIIEALSRSSPPRFLGSSCNYLESVSSTRNAALIAAPITLVGGECDPTFAP